MIILSKRHKFFDNIPTPSDFKLGPGDEVILSFWGETNQRERYIIDKNGMIFSIILVLLIFQIKPSKKQKICY